MLLSIPKAFQDEIITDSGLKFYLDGSYRKEWTAAVTATVAALPDNPNPKHKHILDNLKVGDEVCVSYRVVADFNFRSDSDQYMLTTEENDRFREYVNAKGWWVKVYAFKGKIFDTWAGIHQDSRMNLIDGIQGTQSEVETWLSQFPLGKTDRYTFNNFFEHDKQQYWRCDLDDIFCKKEKGHLKAIGDRVLCHMVENEVPQAMLIDAHKGKHVKIRYTDRGRVLTGGKSIGLKKDEVVGFDPKYVERYTFYGKEYYLIREDFVTGKWN